METLSYTCLRKRKAESDEPVQKRVRQLPVGNHLPLSRLLQYTNKQQVHDLLLQCVHKHPDLAKDIRNSLPPPSLEECIDTLQQLLKQLTDAFPYGGDARGDYAYHRVKHAYMAVFHALNDLVPCFLPPHSSCYKTNFAFLDAATNVIHKLPEFHNANYNVYKYQAYYELSGAWIVVLRQLEDKPVIPELPIRELQEHNKKSQNRLQEALDYVTSLQKDQSVFTYDTGFGAFDWNLHRA
ncbi:tethering factor for nuclear proteasome Cut8 [Schizosaccharomyces japonicus yFS275]|uniref:Tethering factor for nuclear proteasome STS1 n=1 Tax=Schizosaccharomyces japonicus (strain yFS275 / FY16936) TaxID=402676 RepID=B6JUT1_SCHJY|nr:tethering factor for nuclear proteasome Cut8 [Schizosaccharomyces japonicus yFS275]EEB05062.1 tethering factor for nuclear proteasome Cut8 [Schizosaccharomyces japonicus yFS275]